MAFEGLSAQISAEAIDYNTTIERAKERTEELAQESDRVSLSMQVMQGRIDESADESRDLAASALAASGGLTSLATSGTQASLSMTSLSIALTGSVAPALGAAAVAALALVAVIATLGAAVLSLVGTFGLLLGAGVVTHLEDLKEAFQDVIPRIKDALRPLGRVFGPLLEQAIRAIPELVRRIVSAVGGVQQFRTALEDLGALAMEAIPPLVGAMTEMARTVMPTLRRIISFIKGEGRSILDQFQQTWVRISDELVAFAKAIIRLLPHLIQLGGILAEGTLPLLTAFINGVTLLIRGINWLILTGEAFVAWLNSGFNAAIEATLNLFDQFAASIKIMVNLVIRLYNAFVQLANVIPGVNMGKAELMDVDAGMGVSKSARTQSTRRPRTELRASTRRRRSEDELPPIEVKGDTGVVEDVAWRTADQRVGEERRRVRRSGRSTSR